MKMLMYKWDIYNTPSSPNSGYISEEKAESSRGLGWEELELNNAFFRCMVPDGHDQMAGATPMCIISSNWTRSIIFSRQYEVGR